MADKFLYKIVVVKDTQTMEQSDSLDDAMIIDDAAAEGANEQNRQAPWLVGVISVVNGVLTGTIHGEGTSHPPLP